MYPCKALSILLFLGIEINIQLGHKFSHTLPIPSKPLINLSLVQKPRFSFQKSFTKQRKSCSDLQTDLQIGAAWLKGYCIQLLWDPLWPHIWSTGSAAELPQHTVQFVFKHQTGFKQGDLMAAWLWWRQSEAMTLQAVTNYDVPIKELRCSLLGFLPFFIESQNR